MEQEILKQKFLQERFENVFNILQEKKRKDVTVKGCQILQKNERHAYKLLQEALEKMKVDIKFQQFDPLYEKKLAERQLAQYQHFTEYTKKHFSVNKLNNIVVENIPDLGVYTPKEYVKATESLPKRLYELIGKYEKGLISYATFLYLYRLLVKALFLAGFIILAYYLIKFLTWLWVFRFARKGKYSLKCIMLRKMHDIINFPSMYFFKKKIFEISDTCELTIHDIATRAYQKRKILRKYSKKLEEKILKEFLNELKNKYKFKIEDLTNISPDQPSMDN